MSRRESTRCSPAAPVRLLSALAMSPSVRHRTRFGVNVRPTSEVGATPSAAKNMRGRCAPQCAPSTGPYGGRSRTDSHSGTVPIPSNE